MVKPSIIVSQQDLARLQTMLESQSKLTPTVIHLEEELARAEVMKPQDMPKNVVTMNAKVLINIAPSTESTEIHLVYPHDFRGEKGQVNILAPVGAAILGLSEGQEIEWPQPDGHLMQIKVIRVLYQPEREGDYL